MVFVVLDFWDILGISALLDKCFNVCSLSVLSAGCLLCCAQASELAIILLAWLLPPVLWLCFPQNHHYSKVLARSLVFCSSNFILLVLTGVLLIPVDGFLFTVRFHLISFYIYTLQFIKMTVPFSMYFLSHLSKICRLYIHGLIWELIYVMTIMLF